MGVITFVRENKRINVPDGTMILEAEYRQDWNRMHLAAVRENAENVW